MAYFLAGDNDWTYANDSAWDGNWHETEFGISGEGFNIYASRRKHQDGRRIRDVYETADGILEFALWVLKNHPAANGADGIVERLTVRNFLSSLDTAAQKAEAKRCLSYETDEKLPWQQACRALAIAKGSEAHILEAEEA